MLPQHPTLRNHVDRIVASMCLLAVVAIADAPARSEEANEDLARGDADLAAGKFEKAIKAYEKAWDAAIDED